MDRSSVSNSSTATNNDENLFRAPSLPAGRKFTWPSIISRSPMRTVISQSMEPVKMSISPGTDATEEKKQKRISRLKERYQSQDDVDRIVDISVPASEGTEGIIFQTPKDSLESSHGSFSTQRQNPLFNSDISCILPPADSTYTVQNTPNIEQQVQCITSTPYSRKPATAIFPQTPAPNQQIETLTSTLPRSNKPPLPSSRINKTLVNTDSIGDRSEVISKEEACDQEMPAVAAWANIMLRGENEMEEINLGQTKQEANNKLHQLLSSKSVSNRPPTPNKHVFSYKTFLRRKQRDVIREKAARLYLNSSIPNSIRQLVADKNIGVRDGCNVYSDIFLQKTLLRVFLSFHPIWLHLGMETVFEEEIVVTEDETFATAITRFILHKLFQDENIMKQKKFAYGTVTRIVTDAGREALHKHFLTYTCLFLFFAELAKINDVVPHSPRLFVRNSSFKSLEDVFSELSRELLTASGCSLIKMFTRLSCKPTYKQGFFDEYEYNVEKYDDIRDGVVLGKLVEIVCGFGSGQVMAKLRNPGGDRLRKIGNVSQALKAAINSGLDLSEFKAEAIVAGDKKTIHNLLMKIIGMHTTAQEQYREERRQSASKATISSSDVADPLKKCNGGEDVVLISIKNMAAQLGITITSLDDLRDGHIFARAWNEFNIDSPPVILPDRYLFKTVTHAAMLHLDVPNGLHRSVALFAQSFFSRLLVIKKNNDAARTIQKAYRGHRFMKMVKDMLAAKRIRYSDVLRKSDYSNSQAINSEPVLNQTVTLAAAPKEEEQDTEMEEESEDDTMIEDKTQLEEFDNEEDQQSEEMKKQDGVQLYEEVAKESTNTDCFDFATRNEKEENEKEVSVSIEHEGEMMNAIESLNEECESNVERNRIIEETNGNAEEAEKRKDIDQKEEDEIDGSTTHTDIVEVDEKKVMRIAHEESYDINESADIEMEELAKMNAVAVVETWKKTMKEPVIEKGLETVQEEKDVNLSNSQNENDMERLQYSDNGLTQEEETQISHEGDMKTMETTIMTDGMDDGKDSSMADNLCVVLCSTAAITIQRAARKWLERVKEKKEQSEKSAAADISNQKITNEDVDIELLAESNVLPVPDIQNSIEADRTEEHGRMVFAEKLDLSIRETDIYDDILADNDDDDEVGGWAYRSLLSDAANDSNPRDDLDIQGYEDKENMNNEENMMRDSYEYEYSIDLDEEKTQSSSTHPHESNEINQSEAILLRNSMTPEQEKNNQQMERSMMPTDFYDQILTGIDKDDFIRKLSGGMKEFFGEEKEEMDCKKAHEEESDGIENVEEESYRRMNNSLSTQSSSMLHENNNEQENQSESENENVFVDDVSMHNLEKEDNDIEIELSEMTSDSLALLNRIRGSESDRDDVSLLSLEELKAQVRELRRREKALRKEQTGYHKIVQSLLDKQVLSDADVLELQKEQDS